MWGTYWEPENTGVCLQTLTTIILSSFKQELSEMLNRNYREMRKSETICLKDNKK